MFGLQQMLDIAGSLMGSIDHATRAAKSFDSVATVATGELGETMRSAFDAGNNLQRRMVDLVFRGLTALSPQQCVGKASDGASSQRPATPRTGRPGDPCSQYARPNPFAQTRSGAVPTPSPMGGCQPQGWGSMPSK